VHIYKTIYQKNLALSKNRYFIVVYIFKDFHK